LGQDNKKAAEGRLILLMLFKLDSVGIQLGQ
jgi:hypothetical protein